jgi:hypothetical protein
MLPWPSRYDFEQMQADVRRGRAQLEAAIPVEAITSDATEAEAALDEVADALKATDTSGKM